MSARQRRQQLAVLFSLHVCLSWGLPANQTVGHSQGESDWLICSNSSHGTTRLLDRRIIFTGVQKPAPPNRDANCFDSLGNPYTENIANPYDCSLFYKCTIIFGDQPYNPAPIRMECPPGGLCFDIFTCNCEFCHEETTVCFDAENPEHNSDEGMRTTH